MTGPATPGGPTAAPVPADEVWVMPGEAARLLGVSAKQVGNLVDAGALRGRRTRGGHRRVSLASVRGLNESSPDAA